MKSWTLSAREKAPPGLIFFSRMLSRLLLSSLLVVGIAVPMNAGGSAETDRESGFLQNVQPFER